VIAPNPVPTSGIIGLLFPARQAPALNGRPGSKIPTTLTVLPFACIDDEPWFLVVRRRSSWSDAWEPLRGDILPGESPPAAAIRLAREHGLVDVERVLDVASGRGERVFAVRIEAPEGARLDRESYDDGRWACFHQASPLLEERDRIWMRRLNGLLDVFLRRVDVVFEEIRDEEESCTGGCCDDAGGCGTPSKGGCGSHTGCGVSPFVDGRPLSGVKIPEARVSGQPSG